MATVCFGLLDIIHLKPSTLKLLILIIHFRDPKEASLMSTPTDLLHGLKNTLYLSHFRICIETPASRVFQGPPKGVGLMTTFSNMFHMDKSTREKNMIIVSFQNWHWQKNPNLQN